MKKIIMSLALVASTTTFANAEVLKTYFDDRITKSEKAKIKNKLFSMQLFNVKSVIVQGGQYTIILSDMSTKTLDADFNIVEKD